MVIYERYTTDKGIERVKAYSDAGMMIERDGVKYSSADDFASQGRTYTETNEPIPTIETEPTKENYKNALSELGVNMDD